MNIKQMMRQAQKMQEELQQKLAALRVEGSAGGGMVTVEMSGNRELLSIRIEREAVDPDDVDMLQDLILAAVNEAHRKVEESLQSELGGLAGSMGLPPGLI
jgi:DNA-binding YbaB/EbfC family protein